MSKAPASKATGESRELRQEYAAKRQTLLGQVAQEFISALADLDPDERKHVLDLVGEEFCTLCGQPAGADRSCCT